MSLETTLEDVIPLVPDNDRRVKELEELKRLAMSPGQKESDPTGPWEVIIGKGILFSAPHEVTHIRDGAEKVAERGTGALAMALARSTSGSGITTASLQAGDPNWDLSNPYVKRAHILAGDDPVVDIHMMRPRGVELCIGLGPLPNLADGLWQVFIEEAVAAGLRVSMNSPFGANERTVTAQLQARGHRAVQLELSWECFDRRNLATLRAWSSIGRAAHRLANGKDAVSIHSESFALNEQWLM